MRAMAAALLLGLILSLPTSAFSGSIRMTDAELEAIAVLPEEARQSTASEAAQRFVQDRSSYVYPVIRLKHSEGDIWTNEAMNVGIFFRGTSALNNPIQPTVINK